MKMLTPLMDEMSDISIHEDCPQALSVALLCFRSKVHSHTASSRRYPIWRLFEKEVEPTIIKVLGAELYDLIVTTRFSKDAKRNGKELENRLAKFCRKLARQNFRSDEIRQRLGALETLIFWIRFCNNYRPINLAQQVEKRRFRLEKMAHFPFCELCNRLCEAEELKIPGPHQKKIKRIFVEGTRPSNRFCERHRPGTSDYRRDHNRRDAFHQKIKELGRALGNKTSPEGADLLYGLLEDHYFFEKDFIDKFWSGSGDHWQEAKTKSAALDQIYRNYPTSFSEYDSLIRLVAYKTVHPKVTLTRRKVSFKESSSLLEVRVLRAQGLSISASASLIGISRQAAWSALKRAGDI